MCDQQAVPVACMLFLYDENAFQHRACGGVTLANVPNQFSVIGSAPGLPRQSHLSQLIDGTNSSACS